MTTRKSQSTGAGRYRAVALGEAGEFRSGWTSAASRSGDLLMVRTSDIREGVIAWHSVPYCEVQPSDSTRFLLEHGDVLIARTGVGSAGNIALVSEPPRAIFASYLLRFRPSEAFDGRFIGFYLQSPEGRRALEQRAQGATLVNLSAKRVATVQIPAPSRAEQSALADQLADGQYLVRRVIASLDGVLDRISSLERQTFSLALEESGVRDYARWARYRLADVTTNLDRQRVPLNAKERSRRQGDYPYYGASAVIDRVDGWTHEGTFLLVSEDGQNLVSRNAPIAFIANGRFWANNHVHVLAVAKTVSPEYLEVILNATDLRHLLSGTAQPKLAKRNLERIEVPIPTRSVQQKVVRAANRLQEQWADLRTRAVNMRRRTINAWDVLLGTAFAGPTSQGADLIADSVFAREVESADAALKSSSFRDVAGAHRESPDTVRGPVRKAPTPQAGQPARTVIEALSIAQGRVKPEEAFDAIEWSSVTTADPVDAFYSELKDAIDLGIVTEEREEDSIYLRLV